MAVIHTKTIERELQDILTNGSAKEFNILMNACIEILRNLTENGMEIDIPYSVDNKNDIINLMNDYEFVNAFFIRDLIFTYENEVDYLEWFTIKNGVAVFYKDDEFNRFIEDNIPNIAHEILVNPFNGVFKQLYNMIVVPMVLNKYE